MATGSEMTDVEGVLRRVWSRVLECPVPGHEDDFFAGGGDSLSVVDLVAGLQQQTGIDLDAGWVYAHPRFADLAVALRAAASTRLACGGVTVYRRISGRDHPLSAQQLGLLAVLDHVGAQHGYQVAYAVAIPSVADTGRLGDALAQLGVRHTALRTTIRRGRQVIGAKLPALETLRVGVSATAREVATRWAASRIRVEDSRLVRFAVARDDAETLLVMAAHQIVTDPWSWGVLLRDLAVLYTSGYCGETPLQYSDYAWWQHSYLDEARRDMHLRFWRDAATGIPEAGMPLPGAPARWAPAGPTATVPLQIPTSAVEAMRAAAGALRVSLFHLLLALFKTSVARWTGRFDVLVPRL